MTNQLIPRLRFKQFDNNYTNTKFSNLVKRISKHSNSANLPRLSFDNVISGTGITINQNNYKGDGILFNKNDILFGKLRPYLKNWTIAKNKGIAIGDFWVLRPYNSNHLFIYYLIQTSRYNHVANITSGTKMPRSEWGLVSRYTFNIPTLLEQQQIGTFFTKLDHMIELQAKKLSHLRKLKKGYLQKMFPQTDENVPRLRFNNFHNVWNKKKLKDLGDIITGNTPSTKDKYNYDKNGIPWITPTDISNDTTKNTNAKLSKKGASKSRLVPKNSILITCIGSVGNKTLTSSQVGFNQQINALVPYEANPYFIYSRFSLFGRILNKFSSHGIMPIINKNDFSKIVFNVPSIQEQNKIGQFFKHLDQSITKQENKLIQFKQLKKGYLQKMFI